MIKVEKEKEKKKPRGLKRNEACQSVSLDAKEGRRRRGEKGEVGKEEDGERARLSAPPCLASELSAD